MKSSLWTLFKDKENCLSYVLSTAGKQAIIQKPAIYDQRRDMLTYLKDDWMNIKSKEEDSEGVPLHEA